MSDPLSNNDIFIAIELLRSTLFNTCEQEQSDGHCESDRPSEVFFTLRRSYHYGRGKAYFVICNLADRACDSDGPACVMARRGDGGVQTGVSGIRTTNEPRFVFDWHDGLINFTSVGSYVATLISMSLVTESECVVRCAERTVVSAVEFVSERLTRRVTHTVVPAVGFVSDSLDSILWAHVSHRSELFGIAFLHVMQRTGDACHST